MKSLITLSLFLLTSIYCFSQTWQIKLKNDTLNRSDIRIPECGDILTYSYENGDNTELIFDFDDKSFLERKKDTIYCHRISEVIGLTEDYFCVSIDCEEHSCLFIIYNKIDDEPVILFEDFFYSEFLSYYSKVQSIDIEK